MSWYDALQSLLVFFGGGTGSSPLYTIGLLNEKKLTFTNTHVRFYTTVTLLPF